MAGSQNGKVTPEPKVAWEPGSKKTWASGKCPACGSKRSVIKEAAKGEKLLDMRGAPIDLDSQELVVYAHRTELHTPMGDKNIMVAGDVCWDCGTVYALLAYKGTAVPEPAGPKLVVPG